WSRGALGRVPLLAHRRVILFFWPTRASSANQISIVWQLSAFSRAIVSKRVGKLYGMARPSLPASAGDSNGGADDEDSSAWHRPRQECVQCSWSGLIRCCGPTSAGPEEYAHRPGR